MLRTLFAAAAAVAFFAAQPVFACEDCKNCPTHKDTVAQADKAEKKDAVKAVCACGAATKAECKCGTKCTCGEHKGEKKVEEKKS